ncbi:MULTISPECIES: iron-containing alcohol dehydrogenase [unclassified Serratia (in: enterobacteria)]|uniref:iron-containing alcohol dehydrogenase n=1 Tax=unclassified Serratia (in: enterobacteria) TaxID=2647522 RepID=UPI00050742B7|nr:MULTISPECIES: iron-containing alcohol dehydrogenase [unclassified Serratia (in: enterobacteria)]KFK95308.1 alcohol dehydrogenase [Serratia sp. Ag2]KFK98656.1 alcohol dehydrogenase [Serratia sp. Ag1]
MTTSQIIANRQTYFGKGSIQQLLPLLRAEPQTTLLFTCRSFLAGSVYSSLADTLTPLLVGSEIVSHEASPQEIDVWVARWRGKVKRVVAIGGGSVLDAAKAFAAIVEHPLPTLRYMEKVGDSPISGATLPVIAVPTTAGTGSEATQNAVLTDTRFAKVKASLRHHNFVPQVAILDPALLEGAPDDVLAYCALDAFTHLLESYLSKTASSLSRTLSLAGIQHFLSAWPMLKHSDEAREAIMQASYLGGLTLSTAGLGVIHGIAGEIGALRNYHHGQICGCLLLPFLELLNESEHPQQRALMAELAYRLFPTEQGSPAHFLIDFITRNAIVPFWQNDLPLSHDELTIVLEKSNSKNAWVNYSQQQRRWLIEGAFPIE